MRQWLSRLAFSFIILAAVFFWEARRAESGRATLYVILGALCLGLGLAGIRQRHRPER